MAIYHLSIKNISRGDGRSAVAAAAYRSGQRLWNAREDRWADFSVRQVIVHTEILAPPGAPRWALDRERLWNAVEAAEKRKDARLCKEVEIALPVELSRPAQIELARSFATHFTATGLIADIGIHDDEGGNPHAHMLLTTRPVDGDAFGKKLRALDSKSFVTGARRAWAALANAALQEAGISSTIDHRTLAAQGIDRPPQVHQGPVARKMAERGQHPESKTVHYRSPWGNVREVDYRRIDTGSRVQRSKEVHHMNRHYDELTKVQRQLTDARAEEPDRFEDITARSHRVAELSAQREHLLTNVEREEIERGLGLSVDEQRELLDQWDRENRPVPDRDGRPVHRTDPAAVREERLRNWDGLADNRREHPGRSAGGPGPQKEVQRSPLSQSIERGQLDRDIERIRTDPLLSDAEKDRLLKPLVTRSLDLTREEHRLKERPASTSDLREDRHVSPEDVRDRMERDYDEQERQYQQSRGVDDDNWWDHGRDDEGAADHTARADRRGDHDRWWEQGRADRKGNERSHVRDRDDRDRDERDRDRFD